MYTRTSASSSMARSTCLVPFILMMTFLITVPAMAAPATGSGSGIAIRLQQSDTTVRLAAAPRHEGVARLDPDLSIGVVDGSRDYIFAHVTDVVPTMDGSILVADRSSNSPMLREYDAQGKYVRTFGRRGEGPGEYRSPAGVAQLPDGRVLLVDAAGRRINVYSRTGTSLDQWALDQFNFSLGLNAGLHVNPDGMVHVRATMLLPRSAGGDMASRIRRTILLLDSAGTVLDTIFQPDLPISEDAIVSKVQSVGRGSATVRVSVPYVPVPVWTWSPNGYMVTGVPDRYAFELRVPPGASPDEPVRRTGDGAPPRWMPGNPVVSIRRRYSPVSVSRAERNDQHSRMEALLNRSEGTQDHAIPDVPARKPAYREIDVTADGRILVTVSTPSEKYDPEVDPNQSVGLSPVSAGGGRVGVPGHAPVPPVPWREPTLLDVFEPDGTWVGQIAVPYDTRIFSMKGDTVWGVTTDENDIQFVRRFRIVWP